MKMNFSDVKFVTDVNNQDGVSIFRRGDEFESVSIDYDIGQLVANRNNKSVEHIFPKGVLEDPKHTIFICMGVN